MKAYLMIALAAAVASGCAKARVVDAYEEGIEGANDEVGRDSDGPDEAGARSDDSPAGDDDGESRADGDGDGRNSDDARADDDSRARDDGEDPRQDTPDRTYTYYADVKPIIDAKCTTCHFEGGIAPMPLTDYDEVEVWLDLIGHDVRNDIMPPWTADMPMDFFLGDRRLTDNQKDIVLSWVDQGGTAGDPDDAPDPIEPAPRGLERVDLSVPMPEAYEPQIDPDDYRCFVLEWPLDETKLITGLSIEPDKTDIVHHAIVYHVQPEGAEAARARDAEEEGQGYTCFGASGAEAAWLQSYEPGGYGQGIPGGLGFEVRPGSVMVLQIHYNTLNGSSADQSRIDFTLEDSVDRVGDVVLFARPTWFAGFMPIPAGEEDVMHFYRGRPVLTANDRRYEIFWVDLHMHALGSRGRIGIIRAGEPNVVEPLLVIPRWDFAWQETYLLSESVILEPGDELYLECHWDNTAANQITVNGEQLPPRDVNWGDGTTDEMCLGNVLAAPL